MNEALNIGTALIEMVKKSTPLQLALAAIVGVLAWKMFLSDDATEEAASDRGLKKEADDRGLDQSIVALDMKTVYDSFNFGWWIDPRTWWENEDAIISVMSKYQSSDYNLLQKTYGKVSAGRSLTDDLIAYMSREELSQISHVTGF